METLQDQKIPIYYPASERPSAELLSQVIEKTDHLMSELWGLHAPEDCRVYIMTDWREFLSHAPPKSWRLLMKLLNPILSSRMNRLWPYVGGWEQRFGKRIAVGVKTPELIQQGDSSIGDQIFIPLDDMHSKFQSTACHELTHAYSTHLVLPAWLKEGLAMLSVDRYLEYPSVKPDTLEILENRQNDEHPGGYRNLKVSDPNELIYFYARSYWMTRYIEETRPGLLKSLFDKRYRHKELESRLAAAYHLDYGEFWKTANQEAVKRFNRREPVAVD